MWTSPDRDISPSIAFDQQLERIRLRALRAYALATPDRPGRAGEVATLDGKLADLERASSDGTDPARRLAELLGLTDDERLLVWSAVAATVDLSLALHLGDLGPRAGRVGISLAQVGQLFDLDPRRGRALAMGLGEAHPLRALRLLVTTDDGPLTPVSAFTASPRLTSFLAGRDQLDPELADLGGLAELPPQIVSDAERDAIVARVRELLAGGADRNAAVILQGRRGSGRRTIAREACGAPVVVLDLERTGRGVRALGAALAALAREALLRGATAMIAGVDDVMGSDADSAARRHELVRFIDRSARPVVLTATHPVAQLEVARPLARVEVPLPGPRTRLALWQVALDPPAAHDSPAIERAALRFQLGPGGIAAAAAAARKIARSRQGEVTATELADGVRTTVDERLQGLARRHVGTLGWDDLVLPADTRAHIDLLLARVRHSYRVLEEWGFQRHLPGSGVSALFSGPPGTGKTMVAGILARELGLELYRVDLSQIVSKWVGETEKQLDQVFAAADVGHVVLLFDEADALFAKRTEVKGATERYANMEVNFLLQRLESFAGVAILTTNMDGSLDPAFRRRLAAHIQFPHPEEDERAALWLRLTPSAAPVAAGIDHEALARDYPGFAGAHIRNALTTAAFLAADAGSQITQRILRQAADEEARAMGRMVRSGGGL